VSHLSCNYHNSLPSIIWISMTMYNERYFVRWLLKLEHATLYTLFKCFLIRSIFLIFRSLLLSRRYYTGTHNRRCNFYWG
jgi:hypothetical protein